MQSQLPARSFFKDAYLKFSHYVKILRGEEVSSFDEVQILIKSGLLAGCEKKADKASMIIGSDPEADITLLDDGIEPQHISLNFLARLNGTVIGVKALAVPVEILNEPDIQIGETRLFKKIAKLDLNGVQIEVIDRSVTQAESLSVPDLMDSSGDSDVQLTSDPKGQDKSKILYFLMLPVSFFILSYMLLFSDFEWGGQKQNPISTIQVSNRTPLDFLSFLNTEIQKNGLQEHIKITLRPEGGIEASGEPNEDLFNKWVVILQKYDQQHGAPALFNRVIREPGLSDLPQIKFANFGNSPYVLLASGRKLKVGDAVDTGWVLSGVTEEGVFFSLSNKTIKIKYE